MTDKPRVKLNVVSSNQQVPLEVPLALPSAPFRPADVPAFDRRAQSLEGRRLRASQYVIYIDLPGDTTHQLIVHGYTGAYDRVSRAVATYLRSLSRSPAAQPLYGAWTSETSADDSVPNIGDETLERLQKRGYLTHLTEVEEA